jgi:hypothetical protein
VTVSGHVDAGRWGQVGPGSEAGNWLRRGAAIPSTHQTKLRIRSHLRRQEIGFHHSFVIPSAPRISEASRNDAVQHDKLRERLEIPRSECLDCQSMDIGLHELAERLIDQAVAAKGSLS